MQFKLAPRGMAIISHHLTRAREKIVKYANLATLEWVAQLYF